MNEDLHKRASQAGYDPIYIKQLAAKRLVEQGQELMWKASRAVDDPCKWKEYLQDAAGVLEKAIDILLGVCAAVEDEKEVDSESEHGEERQETQESEPYKDEETRTASASSATGMSEGHPKVLDAGPTLQVLLLVYSRAGEWQKVYDCAQRALQPDSDLLVCEPHAVVDVTLRRAVALTHLAGPDEREPYRLPKQEMLEQAQRDFLEVQKTRPRDDVVRRGLQHVAFLKTQTAAAIPQPPPPGTEVVTGLARLRAMEA